MKQITKHITKQSNRQSWHLKALSIGVLMVLSGTLAQAATARKPIGDLEIYKAAKPGTASIFMMLDISGSMGDGWIDDDYGSAYNGCSSSNINSEKIRAVIYKRKLDASQTDGLLRDENGNTVKDLISTPAKEIYYTPKGCTKSSVTRYNRLVRLQIALIELLADSIYKVSDNSLKDTGTLEDSYEIGLGSYTNTQGKVLVPVDELTPAQREKLITTAISLTAGGSTPTAHALAESGAYMMGTTTMGGGQDSYSGFNSSVSTSKKTVAGVTTYDSPLNTKECSGNGIYILTDGEPNNSSYVRARGLMNTSLLGSSPALSFSDCAATNINGDSGDRAWGCMANYAALLRNPANNPLKLPIKTATVGFGKTFAGLTAKRSITINGEAKDVIDCTKGTANNDTRNLCKLGERRGDGETKSFGDGGFYYTEESAEIAASIVDFSSSLVQIINTAPSGTITIPQDPYRASNQLPYAYLPMLDPDIASADSIWKGNLKKYALNQGTLFGNSDKPLYKGVAGTLDSDTQDLWQSTDFIFNSKVSNNEIVAGGVYAKLKSPKSGLASLRTVYVEDHTSAASITPVLRKLSVNGSGIPVGFDALVDTATFTQLNQRRLLSFMGFDQVLTNDGQPTSTVDVKDLVLAAPAAEVKVLGGVVHSKPTAISYDAVLDANGRITSTRDDYVLFGSMDGALHLVDADTGEEEFAIISKAMLENQPEALVEGSIKADVGKPYFGVDAPWLVTTDYKYDLVNKKVKVNNTSTTGMFAYGGLRMGGEALYGINISDKTAPEIMFTFNPAGRNNTTSNTNFARLGQIWSKPTAAKIRLEKGDAEPTDVLIFSGGYDMNYEDDEYIPTSAAPARGNALYMVRASDGFLLWSSSHDGTTVDSASKRYNAVPTMINSITGEIAVLDRDNDGLMDHIYAADLGGQIFRADFENARPAKYGFAEVASFSNKRVLRLFSAPSTATVPAPRFYERPVVSFYRNNSGGANNGKLFALVNVISGNRSAPLSTLRNTAAAADRVYGIIDHDVTGTSVYSATFAASVSNLTESNLVNLASELGNTPTSTKKSEVRELMSGAPVAAGSPAPSLKNGWYYPLTRFDGYNNVRYNKGVGDSVVINNLLYTTVYNPDKRYSTSASCTAEIVGGSERQVYCLPYGICMDDTSKSGTGGFVPAGQGIQELTLGALDSDNTNIKVLIGTSTITERMEAANRVGYGADTGKAGSNIKDLYPGEAQRPDAAGGDGNAPEYLFSERYTMQPKVWYERQQ